MKKRPTKAAKPASKGATAPATEKRRGGAPAATAGLSEGLPLEDWTIRVAFSSLMDRCAAEDIEGDIARLETKEVFLEMLEAIFQAAQKNPKLKGPAWAGGLLAEVLSALEKHCPTLEENPAFAARYSKLKSYRIPPTPLWPWIERAYQRMNFVVDWNLGLHPFSKISSAEQAIPATLDKIQGMGEDEAAREMFNRIIWPILRSWDAEIRAEDWFEPLARHAKGCEVRNITLPLLKSEFMRVWKVFIDRPEGRLNRIERPQ
jgi:hypothetical protein